MKTTDLYNAAGCNAVQYAVDSGAYPSVQAWETAKTRDSDIPADRLSMMLDKMIEHRDRLNVLIRKTRKVCGKNSGKD